MDAVCQVNVVEQIANCVGHHFVFRVAVHWNQESTAHKIGVLITGECDWRLRWAPHANDGFCLWLQLLGFCYCCCLLIMTSIFDCCGNIVNVSMKFIVYVQANWLAA